jgi:4-carboxymuconolactone decarboxylase
MERSKRGPVTKEFRFRSAHGRSRQGKGGDVNAFRAVSQRFRAGGTSRASQADVSLASTPRNEGRGSMARIKLIDRAEMNAEQARVYDAAKAAGSPLGGPYYAYIRLPKLFEAAQNLRACLASGLLSRREQQVVNLTVARHWNARYPWYAQVRASLAAGIEQAVIDTINAGKTPDLADARERTCFAVAREMLTSKGLSDATYAAAEKTMGEEALVALVAMTGSFSMTCMTAATFDIEAPADNQTPLKE